MLLLHKISEVSRRYNVTSRTLRYYEEIGLLESIRDEDTNYRYYHKDSLRRLEEIIALRNLQLSIKDIQEILKSRNVDTLLQKLKEKSNELSIGIDSKKVLKDELDRILLELSSKKIPYEESFGLIEMIEDNEKEIIRRKKQKKTEEELKVLTNSANKLGKNDVRIISLKPFKVAYCKIESTSPEVEAWEALLPYIKENGLNEKSTTRYFGFNNPNPSEGNPVYGYEVWVTVDDNVKENATIKIKEVQGGLYAVTMNAELAEIGERWQKLGEWVEESEYIYDSQNQWLEEHILLDIDRFGEDMQMDLYCPVKMINKLEK